MPCPYPLNGIGQAKSFPIGRTFRDVLRFEWKKIRIQKIDGSREESDCSLKEPERKQWKRGKHEERSEGSFEVTENVSSFQQLQQSTFVFVFFSSDGTVLSSLLLKTSQAPATFPHSVMALLPFLCFGSFPGSSSNRSPPISFSVRAQGFHLH